MKLIMNLKIVRVDHNYCDYLRKFDSRVVYNNSDKETRPYVGVLFMVNNYEYFAPISSPKDKHLKMHNSRDFFKIDGGRLGAINLNNMMPVKQNNYTLLDLNKPLCTESELQYNILLKKQLSWLNKNYEHIKQKSKKLYELSVTGNLPYVLRRRCCNFKLLEEKCEEYNRELITS